MEYVVYILYSSTSNRNYTGLTSNLIQRYYSHSIFGKDSTSLYHPWILVHVEFFSDKAEALRREKYYKSGSGSRKKQELIKDYLARWAHTLPVLINLVLIPNYRYFCKTMNRLCPKKSAES